MEQVDCIRRLSQELGESIRPVQILVEEKELGYDDGHRHDTLEEHSSRAFAGRGVAVVDWVAKIVEHHAWQ